MFFACAGLVVSGRQLRQQPLAINGVTGNIIPLKSPYDHMLKKHSISLFLLGLAITLYLIGLTLPASGLMIIAMVVESHLWVRLTSPSRRKINHH